MLHDPFEVRAAFEEAATTFLHSVRSVTDEQWDRAGALGEWSTRELVAHTLRAFYTVERYLAAEPQTDRVLADATEYYAVALADPTAHRGVLERGRRAGRQLFDPAGEAEATIARVLALVAATADDEPVNTFAGQITLSEYLATRVVEVGVHTLDLQRATSQLAELHPTTAATVLAVLTQLASPVPLILAVTGRSPLPAGYNLLS